MPTPRHEQRRDHLKYNDNRYLRVSGPAQVVSGDITFSGDIIFTGDVTFSGSVNVTEFNLPYGWALVPTPDAFYIYKDSIPVGQLA
jgi:hypothetical protein